MDSKRTYAYNVVLRENDVCPQGELLTGKEPERMKQHNPGAIGWKQKRRKFMQIVAISVLVYDLEQENNI